MARRRHFTSIVDLIYGILSNIERALFKNPGPTLKIRAPILHELVTNKIKIADSCPSWKINWCSKNRTTSIFPRRPDNLAKSGYELINGNNEHQGSHQTVREVTCIREDAEGNLFFYWKWALHSALAAQTLSTGRLLRNNGSNLIAQDAKHQLSPLRLLAPEGFSETMAATSSRETQEMSSRRLKSGHPMEL